MHSDQASEEWLKCEKILNAWLHPANTGYQEMFSQSIFKEMLRIPASQKCTPSFCGWLNPANTDLTIGSVQNANSRIRQLQRDSKHIADLYGPPAGRTTSEASTQCNVEDFHTSGARVAGRWMLVKNKGISDYKWVSYSNTPKEPSPPVKRNENTAQLTLPARVRSPAASSPPQRMTAPILGKISGSITSPRVPTADAGDEKEPENLVQCSKHKEPENLDKLSNAATQRFEVSMPEKLEKHPTKPCSDLGMRLQKLEADAKNFRKEAHARAARAKPRRRPRAGSLGTLNL